MMKSIEVVAAVIFDEQGRIFATQRGYGPEMALGARIPVPAQCQERAGKAGHSDAQIQNGYFRQRLFLARA